MVRRKDRPASRAVDRVVLRRARPRVRDRDARSRVVRAEAPRCLIVSEREGTRVSKRRKRREGISQRRSRMAVMPMSSMRSGEWERTRVDQVM